MAKTIVTKTVKITYDCDRELCANQAQAHVPEGMTDLAEQLRFSEGFAAKRGWVCWMRASRQRHYCPRHAPGVALQALRYPSEWKVWG